MPGLYSHTTRAAGTILTASIYNTDHTNHITNQTCDMTDDYSSSVAQMQATTDPGESGTESTPTSLAGELERLRYAIREIKGTTYWYESASITPGVNVVNYGADKTGAADSSAAIEAADLAAATLGCRVFFPSGTYLCNVDKASANVDWEGESMKSVTLKPNAAGTAVITVKSTAYGTAIRRMTLDGDTTGEAGLKFENQAGIRFQLEDLIVTQFASGTGYGIETTNHAYSMVWKNVECTYNKQGVRMVGGATGAFQNFTAIGCRFWYNTEYQVYLSKGGTLNRVTAVHFNGSCEIENDATSAGSVGMYANGIHNLAFQGYCESQLAGQLDFDLDDCTARLSYYSNGHSTANYSLRLGNVAASYVFLDNAYFYLFATDPPWLVTAGYINFHNTQIYDTAGPTLTPYTGVGMAMAGGDMQIAQVGTAQIAIQQPFQTASGDTLVHVWEQNANARNNDSQLRVYGNEAAGKTNFVYLMHTGTGLVGIVSANTGVLSLRGGNTERMRLAASNPADTEAAVMVQVNDGGTVELRQVTMGADDSGGAGYRLLRVPN